MELAGVPYLRGIDRQVGADLRLPADPMFPRAWEVVADKVTEPIAVMLGVPFGGGSLSGARCEGGPAAVRAALGRFSAYSSDFDVEMPVASVLDAGDVDVVRDTAKTIERVTACAGAIVSRSNLPLAVVGGDNSITAGAAAGADGLLTFDAHHDVRDGVSNGSPVRLLMEGGLRGERIVQVGIHGFANSRAYADRAREAGITWTGAAGVRERGIDAVTADALGRLASAGASRVWVDVDLDCLDRAFAPGAPAALPGGLLPFDLERAAFACGASPLVYGLDVTELDPSADVGEATVRVACAVLLAFLAGVASR